MQSATRCGLYSLEKLRLNVEISRHFGQSVDFVTNALTKNSNNLAD